MRLIVGFAAAALVASTSATAASTPACDADVARSALANYVEAFNGGQYERLQLLFAREPGFAWYSVAPPFGRTGAISQRRSTLVSYFRARHLKREILRVVKFDFASSQERDGAVVTNFNGQLTRRAVDLPVERRGFKAVIRCGSSVQFIVVSVGTRI